MAGSSSLPARIPGRALPFEWSFHLFTYATAFWAFFTLASTGEIHALAIVGFMAAFILSLFRRRIAFNLPLIAWNGISIIAFLIACYGWFVLGQRMYAVTYFLLYLEAYKLITAAKPRDYLQIYGLSFFHMLAASVSTTSLFFAPMLALYLLLVMAALITFTIRRDAERVFAADSPTGTGEVSAPRRLCDRDEAMLLRIRRSPYLDKRFLLTLPILTVAVLSLGIVIFWMVPRMAKQNFFPGLGGGAEGPRTSGFADQISFGIVGEIQRDPTIVMRATPVPRDRDKRQQYLRIRGTALDLFTGDNWILAADTVRQGFQEDGRRARITPLALDSFDSNEVMRVRLTLEPEKSGYMFLPDQPLAIEFDDRYAYEVNRNTMSVKSRPSRYQPISYTVTSHIQSPSARMTDFVPSMPTSGQAVGAGDLFRESSDRMGSLGNSISRMGMELLFGGNRPRVGDINLALPDDSPDIPVIRETAVAWTAGLPDALTIANEIERRFKSEFAYSLEVPFSTEDDHISRFLVTERSGHCEYFATSMVLMLRSLGIPARIVNGYLTDEWNEGGGGRFLVRQEHAHSWVEAVVDDSGRWITFDPTPASGVGSNRITAGWYHQVSAFYDMMKMAWYETVIDFNHQSQRESFIAMLHFADDTMTWLRRSMNRTLIWFRGGGDGGLNTRAAMGWGLIALSMVGAGLFVFGIRRRTIGDPGAGGGEGEGFARRADLLPYTDLLDDLEQRLPRRPSQTPLVYAASLDGQVPLDAREFKDLTLKYYDARYNGGDWTAELTERARQMREALRGNIARESRA